MLAVLLFPRYNKYFPNLAYMPIGIDVTWSGTIHVLSTPVPSIIIFHIYYRPAGQCPGISHVVHVQGITDTLPCSGHDHRHHMLGSASTAADTLPCTILRELIKPKTGSAKGAAPSGPLQTYALSRGG